MKRKNIAVIMTALETDGQAKILKGIELCAKAEGCNVALFTWFTGIYEKERHNLGELNIAMLPDLNLFDGVILLADIFHMKQTKEALEKVLESVTCPIVTIGCRYKNAPAVWSDSYVGMRTLMEYLVKERGLKKLHFVRGVEGNLDAEARFKAYQDVLLENHIPLEPERITLGDFYVHGGEQAAKEVLRSSLPFPEAIVCANDTMAITIHNILTSKGFRVPEDVLITGYDYSTECQMYYPHIISVAVNGYELGTQACSVVLKMVKGETAESEYRVADEMVVEKDSRKTERDEMVWGAFGQKDVISDTAQRMMTHHIISFEKNIMDTVGFDSWREAISSFVKKINPDEFYYCVNKGFIENVFNNATVEQENRSSEEWLAYTERVGPIISYKDGEFVEKSPFNSCYALDKLFEDTEDARLYIFSSIHYLDRNYGYVVFADCTFPIGNPLYIIWLNCLGNSVENMRKHTMLTNAMDTLDDMYIRDPLTEVYNRFGMERYFATIKERCIDQQIYLQLSFADIDGLKVINDLCGHEEGDRVIRALGQILQKEAGTSYVVRYGGDEFVVVGTAFSDAEVESYWNRVYRAVDAYNAAHEGQAILSVSAGYNLVRLNSDSQLEECIAEADRLMYIRKNMKKAKRAEEK